MTSADSFDNLYIPDHLVKKIRLPPLTPSPKPGTKPPNPNSKATSCFREAQAPNTTPEQAAALIQLGSKHGGRDDGNQDRHSLHRSCDLGLWRLPPILPSVGLGLQALGPVVGPTSRSAAILVLGVGRSTSQSSAGAGRRRP